MFQFNINAACENLPRDVRSRETSWDQRSVGYEQGRTPEGKMRAKPAFWKDYAKVWSC